ncbi:unnamed protein product [Sphacelaria rigidula]
MDEKIVDKRWMTVDECAAICSDYTYYGLQYGVQCWCSDSPDYDVHGSSRRCKYECAGDSSQTCGGRLAMDVYKS